MKRCEILCVGGPNDDRYSADYGETDDAFIVSATIGEGHDAAYTPLKIPKVSVIDIWRIEL